MGQDFGPNLMTVAFPLGMKYLAGVARACIHSKNASDFNQLELLDLSKFKVTDYKCALIKILVSGYEKEDK